MSNGKVYLVGAGPGDPELLTVKGLRLIQSADVIVHDRLIDSRLLSMANPNAVLVDVGKMPGASRRTQSQISDLLISAAQEGRQVVRLKGGDPFVFGRGGEEGEALAAAGVPFAVVPGVTSAIAAPAYAGIPLTHRQHASSFTVVTGNLSGSDDQDVPDWAALAGVPGTLVVLMGWRNLAAIAAALIANGKPPETPAAVVSWGTEPWQKTVTDRLDLIAGAARDGGLSSPAALVVGKVVELRRKLNWFEMLPLLGRRVLVTRTRNQAGVLSRRLGDLGALPIEIPTIEVIPAPDSTGLDAAIRDISSFDWIVFASANVVRAVRNRLKSARLDSRALYGVRSAVIGPATAVALAEIGIDADLVPETATSQGLTVALASTGISGSRILLPRADIATGQLPKMLETHGAIVSQVTAYSTVIPSASRESATQAISAGVDVATFTSSSTVRNLLRILEDGARSLDGTAIACIGPVTASTASRFGLNVDIVAETPTIDGLVRTLVEHFAVRQQWRDSRRHECDG